MANDEVFTMAEVAAILKISRRSIARRREAMGFIKVCEQWRLPKAALDKILGKAEVQK